MAQQHTPGEWTIRESYAGSSHLHITSPTNDHIAVVGTPEDAVLIAEAGTVASETGLTPRQLAEQRAELLAALQKLTACFNDEDTLSEQFQDQLSIGMEAARAAIAKAEGRRPAKELIPLDMGENLTR